ncbi:MCE family protein [Nocardia transvalensis]|uniref:MCE family protein n=1 Tax=Nocardia transvalensis TaxID=37333 RepID=UPI0018952847|nr:MlaD family protein [Nocardia transvalensis]MBF6332861.1 MCE family protein [Nocardia transvalensis]
MRALRWPMLGFGVFALVSLLVTTVLWNTLARSVAGPTHSYTATFSDVLGLRVEDDVRMAGVRVGKVTGIALDRDRRSGRHVAKVTFRVQRAQTLYTDTKALVRYQNLIGQRYVALAPGTAADARPLPAGGSIPLERTEPSFDLSGLLNGFQPLFSVLSPEQVNRLSNTLVQALQGDGISLSAFIVQAAELATDFHRRDAILADVITNLGSIMHGLAVRGGELETLVAQTRSLIDGLYRQGQSLLRSTEQIAADADGLVGLVDRVQPTLARAQTSVHDALTLLLANGAKFEQAAVDVPAMLADLGRATQEGAYVNAYPCSVDVSLYGILLPRGLLTRIGGNSHSAVCRG